MANKQVNELEALGQVTGNELVPVYDVDSTGTERLTKVTVNDLLIPQANILGSSIAWPTPICIPEINVSLSDLGANGQVIVTAADFIRSVVDSTAIGGGPPYTYGINLVGDAPDASFLNPKDAYITLTCTDFAATPRIVEVYVCDKRGWNAFGAPPQYYNYVECTINIQDPFGVCPP